MQQEKGKNKSKKRLGKAIKKQAQCSAMIIVLFQQWDPELARVAQKWADQCAQVDYKGDVTRKDPILVHDKHADRKIGSIFLFSNPFFSRAHIHLKKYS